MVVGLTGGIGSGKSTVLKFFKKLGTVATYIADKEAKELMNTSLEIRRQLIKEFGIEVFKDDKLNRPYLANIVFNDKEKLSVLNAIVHPAVHKHLQNFINQNKDKDYILYENAILFENGSDKLCDKIITVTAPQEIRIERVIKRDNTTKEEVLNRMKNQWSDTKKILQSNYVIHNLDIRSVEQQTLRIHKKLTLIKG